MEGFIIAPAENCLENYQQNG